MTAKKKFILILAMLLVAILSILSFGTISTMSVQKASAAGGIYPFRRYEADGEDHKMERYYLNHWKTGQNQHIADEPANAGTWAFGYGYAYNGTGTFSFTAATKETPSTSNGNDSIRYTTGTASQMNYGFNVSTPVATSNQGNRSMFVWTAEEAGSVKFTGIFSRRSASTNLTTLTATYTNSTSTEGGRVPPYASDDPYLAGINVDGAGNTWTSGEIYETGIFFSDVSTGEVSTATYQYHDTEYVWLVDPNRTYNVEAGDRIAFSLLCHNKGGLADDYSTLTLALFSSEFTPLTPTLTISNDDSQGTISGAADGRTYDYNATVNATITAKTGYVIDTVTWGGQTIAAAANQPYYMLSQTITANTTLSVTYKEKECVLTYVSPANGTVQINNTNTQSSYVYNTELAIKVTPNTGYQVKSVKWNGVDVAEFNVAGFTFNRTIADNSSLDVEFEQVRYGVTITNDSNKGTVTGVAAGETYTVNTQRAITISASSGYKIKSVKWNGTEKLDALKTQFILTETITQASTLVIEYEIIKYTISIQKTGEGTVSGVTSGLYDANTVLNITLTANPGHEIFFLAWGGKTVEGFTSGLKTHSFNVTVTADATLSVGYVASETDPENPPVNPEETSVQVTVNCDNTKGTITGVETKKYDIGATYTINVTAKTGYVIKSIKVNGVVLGGVAGQTSWSLLDGSTLTVNGATTIDVEFTTKSSGGSNAGTTGGNNSGTTGGNNNNTNTTKPSADNNYGYETVTFGEGENAYEANCLGSIGTAGAVVGVVAIVFAGCALVVLKLKRKDD